MNKKERLAALDEQIAEIAERRKEIEAIPDEPKQDIVRWVVDSDHAGEQTVLYLIRTADNRWLFFRSNISSTRMYDNWFLAFEAASTLATNFREITTVKFEVSEPDVPHGWTSL